MSSHLSRLVTGSEGSSAVNTATFGEPHFPGGTDIANGKIPWHINYKQLLQVSYNNSGEMICARVMTDNVMTMFKYAEPK